MTTMTSYANGVPSWVGLATPALAAAKELYTALAGVGTLVTLTDPHGAMCSLMEPAP